MITGKLILTSLLTIILGVIALAILSDGFLDYDEVFNFDKDTHWFNKMLNVFICIGVAGLALLIATLFVDIWVGVA